MIQNWMHNHKLNYKNWIKIKYNYIHKIIITKIIKIMKIKTLKIKIWIKN